MPDIEPVNTPEPESFACPTCEARYILVRAEADGRASFSGEVLCRGCRTPLNGREGRFILKYVLVDRSVIRDRAAQGKSKPRC